MGKCFRKCSGSGLILRTDWLGHQQMHDSHVHSIHTKHWVTASYMKTLNVSHSCFLYVTSYICVYIHVCSYNIAYTACVLIIYYSKLQVLKY